MTLLRSNLATRGSTFDANKASMLAALAIGESAVKPAGDGGGPGALERHPARGKLPPRQRVTQLLDPGAPFLEIGATAAHAMYDGASPAAGMIAGIGRVSG